MFTVIYPLNFSSATALLVLHIQLSPLFQGFARLSAVYGGTYMLNKPECKVRLQFAKFNGI